MTWTCAIEPDEVEQRVEMNADLCINDGEHFFVRGHLKLPIEEAAEPFAWAFCCPMSRESFELLMAIWEEEDRDETPLYFGCLCTELPAYPSTLHLETRVHNRKPWCVTVTELEATDHPLAVEQPEGITMRPVQEIAHVVLGHEASG